MLFRRGLLATTAVAGLSLAAGACGPRTEGLDPSKVPDNVRADYEVFAARCSKCHGLSRPLQAGITDDAQWAMYVRRMRRQQGSGISHEDETVILRFLHWYAADLRQKKSESSGAAPVPSAPPAPSPPSPPLAAPSTSAPAPAFAVDGGAP
ncbi:MAG: hypothetical protein JST00_30525 [Deltaproteobacteria bacterium]|nr:hypothetical protein [Deltaproteobacteria bacterium]